MMWIFIHVSLFVSLQNSHWKPVQEILIQIHDLLKN